MLKLNRKENEVYYNGIKLRINKQASKGPGNEVVYIKDCPEANGQTWISLSRLEEGENEIECKARELKSRPAPAPKYELTKEEAAQVAELQAKIDVIIDAAKARYVERPNLDIDVTTLTEEEKQAHIEQVEKYVEYLQSL